MSASPTRILDFWFEEAGPKNWFAQSDAFDAKVRGEFEVDAIEAALSVGRKAPHIWEERKDGALALIIMLDQFSRNMYRGTAAMFTWDKLALAVAKRAVKNSFDLKTDQERRAFFYMPFMHSENKDDQSECVYLIDRGIDDANTLFHAKAHRKVIEQFGRFPHRNAALGRKSTAEELAYLENGGYTP